MSLLWITLRARHEVSFHHTDLSLLRSLLFSKPSNKPNEAYNEIGYRIEFVLKESARGKRREREMEQKKRPKNFEMPNIQSCTYAYEYLCWLRPLTPDRIDGSHTRQRQRHTDFYDMRWYNHNDYVRWCFDFLLFFFIIPSSFGTIFTDSSEHNKIHSTTVTVMPMMLMLTLCTQYHLLRSNTGLNKRFRLRHVIFFLLLDYNE